MQFDVYNPHENQRVTDYYVHIIEDALHDSGHTTNRIERIQNQATNGQKGIVVILCIDAIKAKKAGYKHVIVWIQGVSAYESYLIHHNKLRFWGIEFYEFIGMRKADLILFCSKKMEEFFDKKYKIYKKDRYIMPCFNEELHEGSFLVPGKYDNNTFIYAGSLAPWQCFEQTVELYSKIEVLVGNCNLRVLVKDKETALSVLNKYHVRNYSIDYVPLARVTEETKRAKFGFCIRENTIINNVATPTKLSSYIANGVMPIYSECLEDFHSRARNSKYCFCYNLDDNADAIQAIVSACKEKIMPEDVFKDYNSLFGEYYSASFHESRISDIIKSVF